MLAEPHEVVVTRRAQGRERLGLGPAVAGDQPHAARASRAQRQRLSAARVLQDSKRLAPEYVGMPGEFQEGYSGVEDIVDLVDAFDCLSRRRPLL